MRGIPLVLHRFFNTLTGRIVLGGLAINLILLPLLLGGVVYLVQKNLQANFLDQVRLDAHLFAETLTQARDPDLMEDMIDDAMLAGRYVYARIATSEQDLRHDAGGEIFQEDFFFNQHGDDIYYISVPLLVGGEEGERRMLFLGYDETPIAEQIRETLWLCAYLVLAYIVAILLASAIFGSLITRPLQRLRAGARRIASGDYDHPLEVLTTIREITSLQQDFEFMRQELVRHNKELEYQSLHDALTHLPNRVLLQDRLRQAIYSAQREDRLLALFMIDLDGFKTINDTLGHHYGDLLLQQVASRIQNLLRKSDTLARFGGDEFCILLPSIADRRHAVDFARKVMAAMEQPFFFEEQPYKVGMSIGIALYPEHGSDDILLMRHADVAMYMAKKNHLDYIIYDAEQDKNSISRLSLMWDLRQALEQHELRLEYQPIFDLRSRRLDAVEILVRWHHPQRGLVMPAEFISLAEQANLIKPLTVWVLEEAIRQCRRWLEQDRDFRISVNLSPRSLQDREHPRRLMDIVESSRIPARRFIMELTESAIIADPQRAREILEDFNALGVCLAIDDFGTGYSSLSSLKKLPLDILKIDKSFIQDMTRNKDDFVIVQSTIELAHNMGLQVVAEGVASDEILQQLEELNCDKVQGFHLGRPLSAARLEYWLDESRNHSVSLTGP